MRTALTALLLLLATPVAAEGWEGPLPADRDQPLDAPDARGLWLGASLEAAVWDRDPWLGATARAGFVHPLLSARLTLPLHLRVWDLPPSTAGHGACRWMRCGAWQRRPHEPGVSRWVPSLPGGVEPLRALSLIDEIRVGRDKGPFHLRIAPARLTLGEGSLVDGVLSSPLAGPLRPAARATLSILNKAFTWEALTADLALPHELVASRVAVRPLQLLPLHAAWLKKLLSGLEVSGEAAVDLAAPAQHDAVDTFGDVQAWELTRPIAMAAGAIGWEVATEGGLLRARPYVTTTGSWGLIPAAGAGPGFGAGVASGGRVEIRAPWVGAAAEATVGWDAPGHRAGAFSTLYLLERRRWLEPNTPRRSAAQIEATGGPRATAGLELAVAGALRTGLTLRGGSTPGSDSAEGFVELAAFGARASVRGLKRLPAHPALTRLRLPTAEERDAIAAWDSSLWLAAEVAVPVWGPFSAYARWLHAPRFVGRFGKLRADDDVTFGLAGDLAFDSPLLNRF